jgi:glucose-1-phosphate adenylyltransferase
MNALRQERRSTGFRKPLLAIVLAGGRGSRLGPLTEFRCKPELPFGKNRLVDFALANVVNSQVVNHTMLLTQYMQQGLIAHLNSFDFNSHAWGRSVTFVPAQQQPDDDSWYGGTANAVYQNRDLVRRSTSDTVVILAADHICKLDIRQVYAAHADAGASFTVCGMVMPSSDAAGVFGVMELDASARIVGFEEKPAVPKSVPGRPGECFASMGIYMVGKQFLLDALEEDHADPASGHDFGKDVIPRIVAQGAKVYAYDYNENVIPGEVEIKDGVEVPMHYWCDAGLIDPYWEANMDLVVTLPKLNLYNREWPVLTAWDGLSPAKFAGAPGEFWDIVLSGGCIVVSPRRLVKSVLSRAVRVEHGASVEGSVIFDRAVIGPGAELLNTIVEEDVVVPSGVRVGFDLAEDEANGVWIDKYHDPSSWHGPIRIVTRTSFM